MGRSAKNDKHWQVAKKRYRLSREVVMMAKKLGLNPKKLAPFKPMLQLTQQN